MSCSLAVTCQTIRNDDDQIAIGCYLISGREVGVFPVPSGQEPNGDWLPAEVIRALRTDAVSYHALCDVCGLEMNTDMTWYHSGARACTDWRDLCKKHYRSLSQDEQKGYTLIRKATDLKQWRNDYCLWTGPRPRLQLINEDYEVFWTEPESVPEEPPAPPTKDDDTKSAITTAQYQQLYDDTWQ
mmetsp:Transcript_76268/g.135095  ORF Transcript_76268/g.135095 Transcript_76268/m.135095 type:complete len:185 (+) Transcript_76268:24-578(+)